MRTIPDGDSLPKPNLGEKIVPEKKPEPIYRPVPGSPGLEQDKDGKLRTNLPLPGSRWPLL